MNRKILALALVSLFAVAAFAEPAVADTVAQAAPAKSTGIYTQIIDWYNEHLNYWSIALLMAIESSFIPFPSELVVPPAAYKALQPGSGLSIVLIVLAASAGALVGAYINYFLAKFLGRPIIYKFADSRLGHFLLLDTQKLEKAENYFRDHGAISTFVGRLITVIRQLISIPAGIANMKLLPFTLYTFLGATIWNCVLAGLGYLAHGRTRHRPPRLRRPLYRLHGLERHKDYQEVEITVSLKSFQKQVQGLAFFVYGFECVSNSNGLNKVVSRVFRKNSLFQHQI